MKRTFETLNLSEPLLKAVADMGFTEPTEVQYKAIPHVLEKEDLIVRSKTGSGKTAAFGLPILQHVDGQLLEPQALILTPTRELAVQVDFDFKAMSLYSPIRTTAVYGQHNINTEIQELSKGATIVTGTPGRVFDHIQQKTLRTSKIRFLVLDEADKMLDMGFLDQVVRIIKTLPKDRITLLFSATMPPEIQRICKAYMKEPTLIEIESETMTVDSIHQVYYRVDQHEKRIQLERILAVEQPNSCMIFCNTRIAVDKVQEFLSRKGYPAQALHGAISQSSRLKTIQKFKGGGFQLLVATDVAARGIHVDDLTTVINYDVPLEKDSYVHRIGRTGRAGSGGKAISLVTSDDIYAFYEIEEHVGVMIQELDLPSDELVAIKRAEYGGKWVNFKIQNPHQERLAEDRVGKPAHQKHKDMGARKPSENKPQSGRKPQATNKSVDKASDIKAKLLPGQEKRGPKPLKQASASASEPKATRVKATSTEVNRQADRPRTTTGRAYTPAEVADTVKRLQEKKSGQTQVKKSLLSKVMALFKGKTK